jgi:hypothetical protein
MNEAETCGFYFDWKNAELVEVTWGVEICAGPTGHPFRFEILALVDHFGITTGCNDDGSASDGLCHEICGADPDCEGIPPGDWGCYNKYVRRLCDTNCQFVDSVNCATYPGSYCVAGYCYRKITHPGCPMLKVWDGEDFKEIETLNIHAPEGMDTVYSTSVNMKPYENGKYKLVLEEEPYLPWDWSHIDRVSLKDEKGKECKLIKAEHSKLGDVLSLIDKNDDSRVETKPGERIELTYTGCEGEQFEFSIEGFNPMPHGLKKAFRLGVSFTEKYGIVGLTIITVSVITVIAIVFGVFKFFAKKF